MKSEKISVSGMHCRSCEMLVQEALSDMGVRVMDISSKQGIVHVEYDETMVNRDSIIKAIEDEGYEVMS
jgi:copper chaperone